MGQITRNSTKHFAVSEKVCTFAPKKYNISNMQTTVSLEGVYVSLPNSDFNLLKTLSKKMGWSIKRQRKSGIEKALDDIKAGRVFEAKSVEDLFEQLEK